MLKSTLYSITVGMALLLSSTNGGVAGSNNLFMSSPDVVDGRTLEDDSGNVYRLYAVRTPSLDATCEDADGASYDCGKRAQRTLEKYASGMLSCQKGGLDEDGIELVRCYDFANRDLGSRLIRAGWAIPDREVSQLYVFEELEAEARKNGMWNGRFSIR
ncbi:MAG: thermonuclease family protein [Pseudomonadota bacterium]